jgi:branched-chain amino acid transport system substrate-binding protein
MTPVYEFLARLAFRDINKHCVESRYNFSFEFLCTCGDDKPWIALEQTQLYKSMGIDLVVGYDWSSQLCVADYYSESNDMVLLSPSSTSPVEHLTEEDNVFRLCPHDFKHSAPMVRMMRSLGVTDAVVIQRGDAWGDGLAKGFKRGFEADGGRVQAVIRYPGEIVGDGFLPHVKKADVAIRGILEEQGPEHVAILLISFSEDGQILEQARSYPALMGVRWFGSEEAVNSSGVLGNSCPMAAAIGLISPSPSTSDNKVYERVNQAFVDEFNRSLGYYDANIYDCCWVMVLSVLEAGSAEGKEVVKVLPEVAAGYMGATGPCILDENGDRDAVDYALWSYFEVDGTCENLRCGTYHHDSDSVEWDETFLVRVRAEK